MADERYEWLDVDAAESLLRGDFVDPVDDHNRADALRLAAALEEVRAVRPADHELPGEAMALAAFREASRAGHRGATTAGPNAPAGHTGRDASLLTVRVGPGHAAARPRRPHWSRPLRYGLVASLAGCAAIGGVAAAASAGMISGPFGGHGSPAPAASVSAAASPGEPGPALPSTGPSASSPGPPATAGSATPSATGDGAESATDEGGTGQGGPDEGSKDMDARRRNGTANGDGSKNATGPREKSGDPTDAEARELYEKTLRECRHYREGTLDDRSRRRLIQLAKGEDNLDRFCDHFLDKAGRNGDGDDSGGNDNDGGGGHEGRTGDDDGGSIPSVSFEKSSHDTPSDPSAFRADAELVVR